MEAPISSQQPFSVTVKDGEPFCKCEDGWTCSITKTEPAKAGKAFSNCSGSCTCDIKDGSVSQVSNPQEVLESSSAAKAFCKCGEGWSCVITKTAAPQEGKTFFECGEGCICVIDETNAVKIACA